MESVDNGRLADLSLLKKLDWSAAHQPALLGGVTVIRGENLEAIPPYVWANRSVGEMAVWLPQGES